MILLSDIPIKTGGTISKVVDQEVVIILPEQGMIKVLNDVGAKIWELVDCNRSISGIVDIICDEYQVSRDIAEQDVIEFVQRLVDKGLATLSI